MKKIIFILLSLLIMGATSFAQDPPAQKKRGAQQAPQQAAPAQKKADGTAKVKKDGTPDMRYKENKQAAKPAQKLKKDGTPDMRHKANKEAAKKK